MKYSIWIGLTLGLLFGFIWAGVSGDLPLNANNSIKQGRIQLIEKHLEAYAPNMYIYDIDGREFVVTEKGGAIYPLDK